MARPAARVYPPVPTPKMRVGSRQLDEQSWRALAQLNPTIVGITFVPVRRRD